MSRISVAVDGPAGAGKSTVSKRVANDLGYLYIDTGAMYRTVAVYAIENGMDTSGRELVENLDKIDITIKYDGTGQRMYLNGRDVTERIRKGDASKGASQVAAVAEVRERLVAMQKRMAEDGGVIMDGRDIGTTVLPDAQLKIYLTASVDERARRRYEQNIQNGIECDLDEIKRDVASRDENDMNRKISPLRKADDAVVVDTTGCTFEESVDRIKNLIKGIE